MILSRIKCLTVSVCVEGKSAGKCSKAVESGYMQNLQVVFQLQ
jgi:hypothetical protein